MRKVKNSKEKNLEPRDFIRHFRAECEISLWHSEFLLNGSLGKGMLITFKNGNFQNFLHKKQIKKFNKEGIELYGNKKTFEKYFFEFTAYVKKAKEKIIPKYSNVPSEMDEKELAAMNKFLGRLWYLYGFLEFPYQDLAIEKSKEEKGAVTNNLIKASQFKFQAREIMNAYFFKNGVIENILGYFLKYGVESRYLHYDELLKLLKGEKIDPNLSKERKRCYGLFKENEKIVRFSLDEANVLYKKFNPSLSKKFIKGISANPGLVRGRVIIAPMLNAKEDIKRVSKKMRVGDILVIETTSPDWLPLCKKAAVIVADQGGMLSHAAVVSRELKIPCIVGTQQATIIFKNGDFVEVDGNNGIVKKIPN